VESKTESKLAGLQLAMAIKNAMPPAQNNDDILNVLSQIKDAVNTPREKEKIEFSNAVFDTKDLTASVSQISIILAKLAEKNHGSDIDFSGLESAINRIYEAIPEYDFNQIAAAINETPDIKPELLAIVSAINDNTSAVRENTQAIEKQNQILLKKRKIIMDAEGKIIGIEVV
jgi:predicted MarR family transcription regulator